MVAVSFYFQVHQPYRLHRGFDFFAIGSGRNYEDDQQNQDILRKVAEKCYLPTNELMKKLIKRYGSDFRVAYCISGTALDQFKTHAPEVITSFQELAETGCVEFLAESYYHSLAFLFSKTEFVKQVQQHKKLIKDLFGKTPKVFRYTELIYNNDLAAQVESMGFKGILAEGVERYLDWRSPNYVYQPVNCDKIALLLKNYRLSDDIAFRFSNQGWSEWPLTAEKYASWLHRLEKDADVINLFMDYETFGEHQWSDSGIFAFLEHLPEQILSNKNFAFKTPSEVIRSCKPVGRVDVPEFTSWADTERDTSAWLGNHIQDAAAHQLYAMEKKVLSTKDEGLIEAWRKLQSSDHFYYMCIKWLSDGEVHRYFNPYHTPYEAFICFSNAMNELDRAIDKYLSLRKADATEQKRKRRRKKEVAVGSRNIAAVPAPPLSASSLDK